MRDHTQELRDISGELIEHSRGSLRRMGAPEAPSAQRVDLDRRANLALALLGDAAAIAMAVAEIARCACEAYLLTKQLDALVRQQVTASRQGLGQLRAVLPSLTRQLELLSERTGHLLHQASAIDPRQCTHEDLHHRVALLQLARESSASIQQLQASLARG